MKQNKYFVSVASGEISQIKYGNNADFTIYATETEVSDLRGMMDVMYHADRQSFWRAQVPIMSYHKDQANDQYNAGIEAAFQKIYQLGDEQTKENIKNMNIFDVKFL